MGATIVEETSPVERRTHGADRAGARASGRKEAGMTTTDRSAQQACVERGAATRIIDRSGDAPW
jgi:hypothetical protein